MEITNNLQARHYSCSISGSKKLLANCLANHILENTLGDVSYSSWNSEDESKDLIILIHGTGAHKKWWDPIAPHLLEMSNVVAVDLPGMGDSGFRESVQH